MAGFPIFVDVGAWPPLVAGGGDLALAKVRLLLKRAALVDVITRGQIVRDLRQLAEAGRVRLERRAVTPQDVRGRPLVISATGDDVEDERISVIARELGVPVNVPDRPQLCTFALGAIVDRGSVTVAIGTDGAAPVLATRLRAEIETHLHPRLGVLAEIARDFRPAVAEALRPGAARRAFWDDIFGGAAATAILQADEATGRALITARLASATANPPQPGRVILVGAGPGDPELLTLKAIRALKAADVVVHDGLMGDAVLDHARREARLISVAKAKGRHSRSQGEINALLVSLAREGKTVVRLKGGDPSIFGRGGEEIDVLRASGIAVEIIPGITAATAVAAALQIPLTHRDISRSVTFISGHAAVEGGAEFDQVDFRALADGRATLAVYMGLSTADLLAARLIASGWSRTTPVLAVSRVSQPGERRVATTLDRLPIATSSLGLAGPTLLIIGEVASLDAAGVIERIADEAPQYDAKEPVHA
ncbi:MAG: siroheme synthase CysG [Hyphomicrobiaceae bacterium]